MSKSDLEEALALQIRLAQLPEPEREFMFAFEATGRRWRFDFCWLPQLVAVEVEGGVWSRGRHVRGGGFTEDCVKHNIAALLGWTVLRVTAEHIESGEALGWIEEALA